MQPVCSAIDSDEENSMGADLAPGFIPPTKIRAVEAFNKKNAHRTGPDGRFANF
jgi:hypothetical protein